MKITENITHFLLMCGNCSEIFQNFMQHLENEFGDEEIMDEEIK
jgi:hypothetical protein